MLGTSKPVYGLRTAGGCEGDVGLERMEGIVDRVVNKARLAGGERNFHQDPVDRVRSLNRKMFTSERVLEHDETLRIIHPFDLEATFVILPFGKDSLNIPRLEIGTELGELENASGVGLVLDGGRAVGVDLGHLRRAVGEGGRRGKHCVVGQAHGECLDTIDR